jgi:hypothetical protein
MTTLNRRQALQVLGAAPAAASIAWTDAEAQQAHQHAQQARAEAAASGTAFTPKFLTAHELATVTLLANLIIPKDERSGGASEAGVPEFIDFMMIDQPARQLLIRGGIKWLDSECLKQHGARFVECSAAQQTPSTRTACASSAPSATSPRPDSSRARSGLTISATRATRSCPSGKVRRRPRSIISASATTASPPGTGKGKVGTALGTWRSDQGRQAPYRSFVASALVPAAHATPPAFEYMARSTTI